MSTGDTLYEESYDRETRTRTYTYPDVLTFNKEPFATVIPLRSGSTFKVHKTEGVANSALSHHKVGAKYKQENGQWVKVWEFYEPTHCEKCGKELDPEVDKKKRNSYYYDNVQTEFYRSPLHKGSYIFSPFLCLNCYKGENEVVEDRAKARRWRAEEKRRAEFDALNKN